MVDNIIVKVKIKDAAKEHGINAVAGEVSNALNEKVNQIIKRACERAKANARNTLMARDI